MSIAAESTPSSQPIPIPSMYFGTPPRCLLRPVIKIGITYRTKAKRPNDSEGQLPRDLAYSTPDLGFLSVVCHCARPRFSNGVYDHFGARSHHTRRHRLVLARTALRRLG